MFRALPGEDKYIQQKYTMTWKNAATLHAYFIF